jgi:hypothetical protein
MVDLALICDGDGLEAPVRMLCDPAGRRRRAEVRGRGVVEQENGLICGAESYENIELTGKPSPTQ